MAGGAAVERGQRIAAQFGIAKHGVEAEAHHHGAEQRFHEQGREHDGGYQTGFAKAHGCHAGSETAHDQQNRHCDEQQIADEKQRDFPVARTRPGPQQLVAQADEFSHQPGVHFRGRMTSWLR